MARTLPVTTTRAPMIISLSDIGTMVVAEAACAAASRPTIRTSNLNDAGLKKRVILASTSGTPEEKGIAQALLLDDQRFCTTGARSHQGRGKDPLHKPTRSLRRYEDEVA